jgi:hypothetical protein
MLKKNFEKRQRPITSNLSKLELSYEFLALNICVWKGEASKRGGGIKKLFFYEFLSLFDITNN